MTILEDVQAELQKLAESREQLRRRIHSYDMSSKAWKHVQQHLQHEDDRHELIVNAVVAANNLLITQNQAMEHMRDNIHRLVEDVPAGLEAIENIPGDVIEWIIRIRKSIEN